MCVVSMIMEHQYDRWNEKYLPPNKVWEFGPYPTQEEIDEFRRLLEKAREYDKKNNEPDCEMGEKRDKLKKLADELGVKIDFV